MARAKDIKLVTLDTETLGFDGAIKRIAMYDGLQVYYGYRFADLLPTIEHWSKTNTVHIYVHNLDFDARKMPELWETGNIKWTKTTTINNDYALITCQKYIVHDSFKILPMSLDKLSKGFEVEHAKKDLMESVRAYHGKRFKDKQDFFISCDKDDPIYLEYLKYDVLSLYEILIKVMEIAQIPLEKFVKVLTTASLSRYLFKNGHGGKQFKSKENKQTDFELLCSMKYWEGKKKFPRSNLTYEELEYKIRESYFGGRTEVFTPILDGEPGKINGYYYDVNSLYPSVMIDNEYPIGFPEHERNATACKMMFEQWQHTKIGLGFVECDIFVPFQKVPPLPCFIEKLCFPTGYISGMWTYTELDYAIKNCGVQILKYKSVVHFKSTYKIFHNFVEHFYKMKLKADEDGNESLRQFAKLILNVAYGYTGMRRDDKTQFDYIENVDKYKDTDRLLKTDTNLGFCEVWANVRAPYIQVQIASYVTSYARIELLKALRLLSEKGQIYYCDTDSVVSSTPLPAEMVHKNILGKWKLEKVINKGMFLQPKVYYLDLVDSKEIVKFKGVTKETQRHMKKADYDNIYNKLCAESKDRLLLEKNISSLPSLVVAQKNNKDWNKLNIRDKYLNLGNKQKRNIDYKNNTSEPWHMKDLQTFETFSFKTKKLKFPERRK